MRCGGHMRPEHAVRRLDHLDLGDIGCHVGARDPVYLVKPVGPASMLGSRTRKVLIFLSLLSVCMNLSMHLSLSLQSYLLQSPLLAASKHKHYQCHTCLRATGKCYACISQTRPTKHRMLPRHHNLQPLIRSLMTPVYVQPLCLGRLLVPGLQCPRVSARSC